MAPKMEIRIAPVVVFLGITSSVGCSHDGAATDARPASYDACTLEIAVAVTGTVQDQDGKAVRPDRVEVLAEGAVTGCAIDVTADVVRYRCQETQPEQTIEMLPIQTYRLIVAVGTDEWQFDVEVERENNCHVRTKEFDVVLSPLDLDAGL